MQENSKDDPAVNTRAAQSALREEAQASAGRNQLSEAAGRDPERLSAPLQSISVRQDPSAGSRSALNSLQVATTNSVNIDPSAALASNGVSYSGSGEMSNGCVNVVEADAGRKLRDAIGSVAAKMSQARQNLDGIPSESLEECERYVAFIKSCAVTIKSLKEALV